MSVLYMTGNPTLSSTTRVLQGVFGDGSAAAGRPAGVIAVAGRGGFADWLAARGVPHLVVPMPVPPADAPVAAAAAAARLSWWARRRGVSLVHCNEHDIYPFGRLVARLLRVPVVCHVRFRVDREFCEWAFDVRRRPDALLWTSASQRDACRGAVAGVVPEDRQHLVYLGIDPDQFAGRPGDREATRAGWRAAAGDVVLGTAAAFEPRKRVPDFIEVVRRLRVRGLPVRGVYAGGPSPHFPDHPSQLQASHEAAGLGDRLVAAGRVDRMAAFYQGIDLYVSTSEMETFGNSVCEAMAARRPVVGYEGGSVREVIGPAGDVVPNGDLDALTEAAARLVGDAGFRHDRAAAGRARVLAEFTTDRVAGRFGEIHRALLFRTQPPAFGGQP